MSSPLTIDTDTPPPQSLTPTTNDDDRITISQKTGYISVKPRPPRRESVEALSSDEILSSIAAKAVKQGAAGNNSGGSSAGTTVVRRNSLSQSTNQRLLSGELACLPITCLL